MLLDSQLVEKFHALHRQRLSGSLIAEGDGFRLEICLIEGEPAAIDIGRDLDEAFIEACRTYHKIDDAALAELRAAVAGGAKARDYLISSQLVSEAEADQVAQASVEDHLCRSFRGPCTRIEFTPGRGPDQLAVGQSAQRMRIGVEALIRTCDAQVTEIVAVEREIGGWDAVFSLNEEENTSGALSEYEKMVLNFIDGRSTVEQIAELCRDSSLNLARVLRSLVSKRVIKRLDASSVRTELVDQTAPGGAATRSAIKDLVPYHAPRPEPGSRTVVLIGLIVLLAISVGVALLVVRYNRRQDALQHDENEINQKIGLRQWNEALQQVAQLREKAGTDIVVVRTIDGLGLRIQTAIAAERAAIKELIASEDFAAARQRIGMLPEDGGLAAELRDAEDDARTERGTVRADVRTRLDAGDVAGALAVLDAAAPKRRSVGDEELAQWRAGELAVARADSKPLPQRLAALARLRQARPDEASAIALATLESTLREQIGSVVTRLQAVEQKAAAGAYVEAQEELAKLRIGDLGGAGEVEVAAARAHAATRASAEAVTGASDAGYGALAKGALAPGLEPVRASLAALLQARPQASGRDAIERLLGALATCSGSSARTIAERADEAVAQAAQVPPGDVRLVAALKAREESLRAVETDARNSLEEARRLGRDGDWERTVSELNRILAKPSWQQTAVHGEAEQELEIAKQHAARRVQLRADLDVALKKGDVAACEAIGREMGLAYLPLAVASSPEGAEVVRGDGKILGTTPLVLDVSADERVDMKLTVRRAGYEPQQCSGAKAEGGWRLMVVLQRAPLLKLALGHPLTARPAVVGDGLWLADRSRVVRIAAPQAGAAVVTSPIEAAALSEPVFAPISEVGGQLILATRERLGLRLDGDGAPQRLALAAPTDWAPCLYRSPLVLDRELLIVAGRDGRLHAGDASAREVWTGPPGSAFAAAPVLVGDTVLCVRSDGRLERVRSEDGKLDNSAVLPGAVVAAWNDGPGIAGLTAETSWSWNGDKLASEALPEGCIGGGPGVVVAAGGRVLLRRVQAWTEVGRIDQRQATGHIIGALTWGDRAVIAYGPTLQVLGADTFRLDAGSDLLPPVLWGEHLAIASLEGGIWVF